MAIHRSGPSESLPLKERNSMSSHRQNASVASAASAGTFDDPDVSPFVDPSEVNQSPFADPAPAPNQYRHVPTLSFGDAAGNFTTGITQENKVGSPTFGTKEAIRSPVSPKAFVDLESRTRKRATRRKALLIGGAIALIAIAAIIVGVVIGKRKSSGSGGSEGTLAGSAGVVTFTDTNDPSTFIPDARLHNTFYGLGYMPLGGYAPDCGVVQANITEDVVLMSQLTTRIRMYGCDCNIASMVLSAIKETKVNLEVYLALNLTQNETYYYEQATEIMSTLQTAGTDSVAGIIIGSGFIENYIAENNTTDPNSQAGATAGVFVSQMMAAMRASMSELNLTKPIPVGTADGVNMFTPPVLEQVDFAMASVMPWRSNVLIQNAATWTQTYFKDYALSTAESTANQPPMYIGETGWPSGFANTDWTIFPGASDPDQDEYIQEWTCAANTNGTGYFMFEAFDETWRQEQYGGIEGSWGLFDSNKQLKNITIPACSHS